MKILMISDVYFPRVNGVSTSISTFRHELARLGHRVVLMAPDYGGPAPDEPDTVRIPGWRVPLDPEDRLMRLRRVLEQAPRLAQERFDIVHIQTPFIAHYAGIRLARQFGIPRLATYHTFFEDYLDHYIPLVPKRWLRAVARGFSSRQCNELDGVVTPSRAMREILIDYGIKADIRVIPTGITSDLFAGGDGAAFRQCHGIAPNRPVLVYVGRLAFEKNVEFLLRVTQALKARHADILLLIAGEGPAMRHLQRLGRRLGLEANLLFVGYLSRQDALADCYRAGNVFVFASRTETQGLVLLEAMQLGIPVVSTAVMGTRDILEAGRGALVAEERVDDFAAKVGQLLEDALLWRRLAAEGPAHACHWQAHELARHLAAYYQELIEGPPRAAGECDRPAAAGRPPLFP